jgi:hypothetical protein
MGSIRIKKAGDGRTIVVDEDATGRQLKEQLGLTSDSILVNARNQIIADHDRVGDKVRDEEEVAAYPDFKYWVMK